MCCTQPSPFWTVRVSILQSELESSCCIFLEVWLCTIPGWTAHVCSKNNLFHKQHIRPSSMWRHAAYHIACPYKSGLLTHTPKSFPKRYRTKQFVSNKNSPRANAFCLPYIKMCFARLCPGFLVVVRLKEAP